MQADRHFVERAFEDAKSTCGMADYQVRGWQAWHHHMALVVIARYSSRGSHAIRLPKTGRNPLVIKWKSI
ncbi:MAG: hypothetical protein IPJ50_16010 [Betaproteobacteria bacterium]|nr:hypothetical protein [Betaproteobacteria bacterium]